MSKTGDYLIGLQMEQGDKEYQEAKQRRAAVKPKPCRCFAYPFPHRKGGGKCQIHAMQAVVVERGGWIDDEAAADWLYDYSDNVERAANEYMEDCAAGDEAAVWY